MQTLLETAMTQTELHKRLVREYGEEHASAIFVLLLAISRDELAKEHTSEGERAQVETALNDTMQTLCPEPCAGIKPTFWDSPAGQMIAQAQFWLWGDEYISRADAARILFGDASVRSLAALRWFIDDGQLNTYRRPNKERGQLRTQKNRATNKGEYTSPRTWVLRRSEVKALAERRKTQE
jgi:hypothetical protein